MTMATHAPPVMFTMLTAVVLNIDRQGLRSCDADDQCPGQDARDRNCLR